MPQASCLTLLPISLSASSPCLSFRQSRSWRTSPRLTCGGLSPPQVSDRGNACHLLCRGLVLQVESVILNWIRIYWLGSSHPFFHFFLLTLCPIPDGSHSTALFPRLHQRGFLLAVSRQLFLQLHSIHWGRSAGGLPASLLSTLFSFSFLPVFPVCTQLRGVHS